MAENIDVVNAIDVAVEKVLPQVVATIERLSAVTDLKMSKDEFDSFVDSLVKDVVELAVISAVPSIVKDTGDAIAGKLRDVSQMDWETTPGGKYQEWYDAMEEAAVIAEDFGK